jgi:hypothetical protein
VLIGLFTGNFAALPAGYHIVLDNLILRNGIASGTGFVVLSSSSSFNMTNISFQNIYSDTYHTVIQGLNGAGFGLMFGVNFQNCSQQAGYAGPISLSEQAPGWVMEDLSFVNNAASPIAIILRTSTGLDMTFGGTIFFEGPFAVNGLLLSVSFMSGGTYEDVFLRSNLTNPSRWDLRGRIGAFLLRITVAPRRGAACECVRRVPP